MRRLFLLCLLLSIVTTPVFATDNVEEKWKGVDESVIERIAKDHGREAKEPLINTDTGDLLLFVFLVAGAVGGFVAGYYWRILLETRPMMDKVSVNHKAL